MWCPTCRADVAAELAPDERCLWCARCATELGLSTAASNRRVNPIPRDAAELLARWSAEELLPRTASTVPPPSASAPVRLAEVAEAPTDISPVPAVPATGSTPRSRHARKPRANFSWVAGAAQLAAYAGVLLLTCGGTMVVSSHYGAPPQRAMNGWLLATIGQMLLFLGVITLVSHGVDQAQAEVARGVKRLSRRLRRLEARRTRDDADLSEKNRSARAA